MIPFLYNILLYVNATLAFFTMVVYIRSARISPKPIKRFKLMIALVMFSSVFIYVQLALPGDFLSVPLGDALIVRINYTAVILIMLFAGLIGMSGGHGQNTT